MIEIKRILCPTDYSEFSRHAFEQALLLARWYGAEVTALHVYAVPMAMVAIPGGATTVPVDHTAMAAVHMAEHLTEMSRFIEAANTAGVKVDPLVLEGGVIDSIVEQAASLEADLIVMGTHGRSGFERLLLGSVTERVLRKAPCPVLTVPRRVTSAAPGFKRILCPIDFSQPSTHALTYALSLAQEADARLTVVHVVELQLEPDTYQYRLLNVPEYRAQMVRAASEQMANALPDGVESYCAIEQTVITGKAYREILRLADEQHADLIVMGVHGRSVMDLLVFGSTTQHVVRQAPCPVLSIRQPARFHGVEQEAEAHDPDLEPVFAGHDIDDQC